VALPALSNGKSKCSQASGEWIIAYWNAMNLKLKGILKIKKEITLD